jgi:hypothetical protein
MNEKNNGAIKWIANQSTRALNHGIFGEPNFLDGAKWFE